MLNDRSAAGSSRDELVAPWLHRPLARATLRIVPSRVTPNQISILAFVLTLVASIVYALPPTVPTMITAGTILLMATVLDAADGERARAMGVATAYGAWLDTMLDKIGDAFIAVAIVASFSSATGNSWAWPLGVAAYGAAILLSYGWKEFAIRFEATPPKSLLDRLSQRDARTFILVLGTWLLIPYWALLLIGIVAAVALTRAILVVGIRTR